MSAPSTAPTTDPRPPARLAPPTTADAMGYELDIIASAVVGGASLAGGRGSVVGAVLGALIFGVLRNALPQIPGATFYDRLIVGLVVIAIVVMDQLLERRKGWRRAGLSGPPTRP